MYSPTGYFAQIAVRNTDGVNHTFLPVLHWNGDGHPVISTPGGQLQAVARYSESLEGRIQTASGDDPSFYINWIVTPHGTLQP